MKIVRIELVDVLNTNGEGWMRRGAGEEQVGMGGGYRAWKPTYGKSVNSLGS